MFLLAVFGIAAAQPEPASRTIALTSTHTRESITARYFTAGRYDTLALRELNRVLRDHRTGDIGNMDPKLFDYLHAVASAAGVDPRFDVISGFRSAASNALLRSRSKGVAQNSQHLLGKAIDIRLRGVPTARVRDIALSLRRGGVGYYPKSDFVHLDTGRVRSWAG